ncbi:MAG: ComEC family competence protein, partial [Cytophagales bacterium]|nr:ComEC family competence protein [Cytophagales bacterium]
MYTWTRFPFVRLVFAGISGILLYDRFPYLWSSPLLPFLILLAIFLILTLISRWVKFSSISFPQGITCLVIIGLSFGWISKANQSLSDPLHWRNYESRIVAFEGVVVSDVLDKSSTKRYSVRVTTVNSKDSTSIQNGQLHLYVKKSKENILLKYGDVIRVYATPSQIAPPTNPEEFNYSAYVARQQIHGQCFVSPDRVEVVGHRPELWVLDRAFKIRKQLKSQIERYLPETETRAIAMALLIGVKDFLSDDLKTAYASAGAMHVLAVSGLHVGILYMILLGFLKPLEKWKGGNVIIAVIAILVIWSYTFVTGMSPSVLRAATMFTVFATSKAINRESNIYNSLGIAAFILMMVDPNLIFEVGFQLSFLAVTGIVYLQPKIYHLLYIENRFLEKIWVITAVSIAAQISTLPLTIYYFHQFPTYFFLSNLVVIPGAMVIMIGGIAMLVFGGIVDGVGVALGFALHWIIWFMNGVVTFIEQIPGSLITWLYFDELQMLLVYGTLILVLMGIFHKSSFYLNASLLCLGFFFAWGYLEQSRQLQKQELIIYDIAGTVAIDKILGKSAELFV